MDKELIKQKTIEYVQYSEYKIMNMAPDTNGNYRTELMITILKPSIPVDNLLTKWTSENPDKSILDFTRVVISFGFSIKPLDEMGTYLNQDVYAIDLNTIEDIGELSTVWVDNPDLIHKVNLAINLKEDFDHLQYLRISGCDLRLGLEIFNKNSLVVELISCSIHEGIQQYENRTGKPNSVYCMITSCQFYNLRGLNIDHIKLFSMRDCQFESVFNSGKDQMMDNLVPALLFKNSDQVIIESLVVRTILTGFEFDKIEDLRVVGFSGKEPVIDQTIKTSMIARDCKEVTFTRIKIPGISVDKCGTVNISNVEIGKTVSQNAKYAVKVSRCTGKISISGIDCEWNSVNVAIAISLCKTDDDGQISICECDFKKLKRGVELHTNSGKINICNCSFKDMDVGATGIEIKTHAGHIKFIDCQFGIIEKGNLITGCENIDFIDCIFNGEHAPVKESVDLSINESGQIRFVSSEIQSINLGVSNSVSITFKKCVVKTSILSISGADVNFEDSQVSSNISTKFETGNLLNLRYTTFDRIFPEFDNYKLVTIDDCVFKKGIKLTTCGSAASYIKESDFGDSQDLKLFSKGIVATGCVGIDIKSNKFLSQETSEMALLELMRCIFCIFDSTNIYLAQSGILIGDWARDSEVGMNNNHIIIDSSSKSQPVVSSSNNFRYMLCIFNRKLFEKQYPGLQGYETIEDVIDLHLNTVSIVNLSEQWVPPYIKTLNSALKSSLNQIS